MFYRVFKVLRGLSCGPNTWGDIAWGILSGLDALGEHIKGNRPVQCCAYVSVAEFGCDVC